jgi:hypothetical protein
MAKTISNYIIDLGRVVAFHPGLKKVTGSISATLLLSQLLYWTPRSNNDGWVYKNSFEWEEETGLTYNEQKTARDKLLALNLIEEENKRLDHTIGFRLVESELNRQWEIAYPISPINRDLLKAEADAILGKEKEEKPESSSEILKEEVYEDGRRTDAAKQGDLLDGMMRQQFAPGMTKMNVKKAIKEEMEKSFHINVDNKKWDALIEFLYIRQTGHREQADVFFKWALDNGFDPIYWTPEKMKTLHPRAFVKEERKQPREDFVAKLPEKKEEQFDPMPSDIGRKRDLT